MPGPIPTAGERLTTILAVLAPVLDIAETAVDEPEPPEWCAGRGWTEFLLGLSDRDLGGCEAHGLDAAVLARAGAPASLRELASEVRRVTALPLVSERREALPEPALRGVPARKREQLGRLLGALAPLAGGAARIVDVGAGSSHFSRLSAELWGRETVALDRDGARLRSGQRRSDERARHVGELPVRFEQVDLMQRELVLAADDLAVGLHACGELGDRLVLAAGAAGCDLGLISCCLQKTRAEARTAISRAGRGFSLGKAALGLSNLTLRAQGVEATLAENLAAREARLGLRRLLGARGVVVRPGEEMRGVNRRRAQAGFGELAAHVLSRRGLEPASAAELAQHEREARRDHALIRRLAMPRHLLARLAELAVVFDRAAALEEHGLDVRVGALFDDAVSPRNTLLLGRARRRDHARSSENG